MVEIFFRKSGKGQPILLLHGFCETHEIWNGILEMLAEDYEVFAVDLPGFGQSALPKTPFSISEISEIVLNWLSKEKINLPFIVGHSLGGYVALSIARQAQLKIRGLCLFNSTPYPDSDERKSNRNRVIEFVEKNGVDPFIDAYVPALFYDKKHASIPFVFSIARRTSKETLIGYALAMRDRPSSIEFLKKIEKPVLTIAGENDSIVTLDTAVEFGRLARKNAVHILKNSGHMGMLEQPEAAVSILNDFVASFTKAV